MSATCCPTWVGCIRLPWWQIGVFTLALILSAGLPKARLDADGPMIAGA